MKPEVIVVTSAYGHDLVRTLGGQSALLPIISASGADGVEIRRELLEDTDSLVQLAGTIRQSDLHCVYSAPEPLIATGGGLALAKVEQLLAEAATLGARLLKLPLGHLPQPLDLAPLSALLKRHATRLVIENDQTITGGTVAPLVGFFRAVAQQAAPIGMTFDMANWHWLGESNMHAAAQLAAHVEYIHVKASREFNGKVHAVALDDAPDTWCALLAQLPDEVPRGIESPLQGKDLVEVTRGYVEQLKCAEPVSP